MKIVLIGRGKMGSMIEQTALAAGDEVIASFDKGTISNLAHLDQAADVVMDFSRPEALPDVCAYVRRTGTALVSGTTGYTEAQKGEMLEMGSCAPVLWSANYSIGIAVFCQLLSLISDTLKPNFDIEITETHHSQKADAPSGTAKLLLNAIDPKHQMTPVYGWEGNGKREKQEIGIHALRGGTVAGTHTVHFFGFDEELEITHRASSCKIFVNGALQMARLITRKPAGAYDLQTILLGE